MPAALLAAMLLVGLFLIVKGGDAFVDAAGWIAAASRIPQFVIGAAVVSVATTLPELLVSAIAATEGSVDLAVGNAVGSITANTALIFAITLLAAPGPAVQCGLKSFLLIAALSVLALFCRGGTLTLAGIPVLALLFLAFLADNLLSARRQRVEEPDSHRKVSSGALRRNLLLFLLGGAGIIGGAQLLVHSAKGIARLAGVPEAVIAVSVVAIGTSLPELVTALTAIMKKQSGLAVGNILGANIIDAALILPVCSVISGQSLPISRQALVLDIPVCLVSAGFAFLPPLFTGKFSRWQGFALLAVYLWYLSHLL